MTVSLPEDPTLDEVRSFLAGGLAAQAAFDGWNETAVLAAAEQAGVDPDLARLAFNDGPVDMIDAWFQAVDAKMAAKYSAEELAGMKIRERIKALVEARLEALESDREGLRRALAILAAPPHLRNAARMGWRAADKMWRLAGDTATDYNHYTKRTLLSGVYGSTIMQFEKVKARVAGRGGDGFSMARFVGRLRYRGA